MKPLPLEVQYSALIEKTARNKDEPDTVFASLLAIWSAIEKHPQLTITARGRLRVQVQDTIGDFEKARHLPRRIP